MTTKSATKELPLNPKLENWLWYIESHIGFVLPEAQHQWLVNAINSVASEHHLTTELLYQELYNNKRLHQLLIDKVLIAETRFFRNEQIVAFVINAYNDYQKTTQNHKRPFNIMSIGCSTGQEVWSLAMALSYHKKWGFSGSLNQTGFSIVGIDANQHSLGIAKQAIYPDSSLTQIPRHYHSYIEKSLSATWQVSESLRQHAKFLWCNVFDQQQFELLTKHLEPPQLIVCQNMLIYFRQFDQRDMLARMAGVLEHSGYLVLGTGEAMFWRPENMKRPTTDSTNSVNVWQKIDRA